MAARHVHQLEAGVWVFIDETEGTVTIAYKDASLALVAIHDLDDRTGDRYWVTAEDGLPAVGPGEFMVATWKDGGNFERLHHGRVDEALG